MSTNSKILVGLSGGLDSTYTAKSLIDEGNEVICAALVFSESTDVSAAERSAREIGAPLLKVDCREDFEKSVISYFAEEYLNGRTPNPCVMCNRYVKMATLFRLSRELGCDGFATGHYCEPVRLPNGRYAIKRAADERKDQSYMLWGMTQEQIASFRAPLASAKKSEIRVEAAKNGLSSAAAKESQDICFIPDGDYVKYIGERFGKTADGNFVAPDGSILGRHRGILNYTVGQRKGLGIALGYHAFITDIDPENNEITLRRLEDSYKKCITVDRLSFQGALPTARGEFDCKVKIRYAAKPVDAHVTIENDTARVEFAEPQRTPAPGQSAVCYDNDVILFGGLITRQNDGI